MTDKIFTDATEADVVVPEPEVEVIPDELTMLKERADQMHITYHPSIGLEKLKEKVNTILSPTKESAAVAVPKKETPGEKRIRIKAKATRLIRIRVTCMDPNKKGWPGEIITVGNSLIGEIKKFVPFNAEEGYHVPWAIFNHIKKKKRQEFREIKARNGMKVKRGYLVPAFAIEELPPLTTEELKALAERQALNHSID